MVLLAQRSSRTMQTRSHQGFTVVYTDEAALVAAGYGAVSDLPCIFDSRPGYHRLGSRFLIDRGLGIWDPMGRGKSELQSAIPSKHSMRTIASRLCNFLEWADVRGVELESCEYRRDLISRYQTEMLNGQWSDFGRALAETTSNRRVDAACDYLTWMADKGRRPEFNIPTIVRNVPVRGATRSSSSTTRKIEVRADRAREPDVRLTMPKDEDVGDWLARLEAHRGETIALMAELVLLTAVRREEAVCWRVDTLPLDPRDWRLTNPHAPHEEQAVIVSIRFGCKGATSGYDHGDKIGPAGEIRVPLALAEKLHAYRNKTRLRILRSLARRGGTLEEQARASKAVHLFLDEKTGARFLGQAFYDAWTSVSFPMRGWSPHKGRHWWACTKLWTEMCRHEHLLKSGLDVPHALLESSAMSVIRLQIQPQLRHCSEDMTWTYLRWIADLLDFNVSIPRRSNRSEAAD
jgi:hypothetical protein